MIYTFQQSLGYKTSSQTLVHHVVFYNMLLICSMNTQQTSGTEITKIMQASVICFQAYQCKTYWHQSRACYWQNVDTVQLLKAKQNTAEFLMRKDSAWDRIYLSLHSNLICDFNTLENLVRIVWMFRTDPKLVLIQYILPHFRNNWNNME